MGLNKLERIAGWGICAPIKPLQNLPATLSCNGESNVLSVMEPTEHGLVGVLTSCSIPTPSGHCARTVGDSLPIPTALGRVGRIASRAHTARSEPLRFGSIDTGIRLGGIATVMTGQ